MTKNDKISSVPGTSDSDTNGKQALAPETTDRSFFPVVGIGASAGGFHATQELLSHLPTDTNLTLVLVQHLKAEYASNLPSLLAKSTSLPVGMAENGTVIQPGQVYILPPGQVMEIENHRLRLSPRDDQATKFRPIDLFFESLGRDCKEDALAVVLSGSGSDGTAGLRVVKAEGGIVLAQDSSSAEFPEMPRHAVETGLVDFILSPGQIAKKLEELCRHPHLRREAMTPGKVINKPNSKEFTTILQKLQAAGVDFTQYKQSTVGRRISRRMALHRIENPAEYEAFLHNHPEEISALKEDMLIKVTTFFRDPEVFDVLCKEVFPQIASQKDENHPFRIWVPGCATGEEVYSLAISLHDFLAEKQLHFPVQIFGTDLSETAINKARRGLYLRGEVEGLSEEQLRAHFSKTETGYQIKKSLREYCIFAPQDFTRDPPFSRLDLISCRNVLIYLGPELQKKVMPIFHYALAPEGFLILGSSESIGRFDNLFSSHDKKYRIYKKIKKTEKLPLNFPPKVYRAQGETGSGLSQLRLNHAVEDIDLQRETDRILLQKYQPAAVVIDAAMNILHFRGETAPFLEHHPGNATLNLMQMIRDSLRVDLRALIHSAQKNKTSQHKKHLHILTGDEPRDVNLDVIPFTAGNDEKYFLIQFELEPGGGPASTSAIEQEEEPKGVIEQLKQDLSASHEYSQSLIEEKESALEELKAANEEILSSNEELQSINEELETAKEELESANEELVTVNQELQGRNEELSRANDDLQNLILSAEIPFLIVNQNLCIQRTSPQSDKIFNVRPDDIGRPLGDIRPGFDVPDLEELIRRVIASAQSVEREVLNREGLWTLLRIRPYKTADNQISGAVITLVDIDRLKRSLEEIEKAHKFALRIVDTIKDPLLVLDSSLQVITANPSFYEHFKVRPKETEGLEIYQLGAGQWNHPELRMLLEEILPKSSKIDNFLVQFEFPSLGQRSMLLSARKMQSLEKQQEYILLAIEDVTQQLKMQEDLRDSKRRAEEASRAKSEFLANMSHEIRTPMTVILSAMEALQKAERSPDQKSYLDMAYTAAHALTDLLSEILDFSRIEVNKLNLKHATFNIRELTENSISILRGEAQRKNLELALKVDKAVPEILLGDAVRLRQVLVNLVSNAIKFTERGKVSVQLEPATDQLGRQVLQFSVSDTGIGIPGDRLDQIFGTFMQIDASNTRKHGGTGLGLAICKGIVERMGGSIAASSKKDEGSNFTFSIPLIPADKDLGGKMDQMDSCKKPKAKKTVKSQREPYRILIVENEAVILRLMEMLLIAHGWQTATATSGKEALHILEQSTFDLVLMDLQMPDMDGIQVTRLIRDQEKQSGGHLPVIALTAYADKSTKDKCLAGGMDDFVTKPFAKDKLFAVMERHLGRT